MNVIYTKLKEVLFSVLPITALMLLLHFTITPVSTALIIRFLIGSFFVTIGLTIFLLGVDIGITPLGSMTGSSLVKTNKVWIVLVAGVILGFFMCIAEPGLLVLSEQVNFVTSGAISGTSILILVSSGLAIMLALGFLRVVYNIPLYKTLMIIYFIVFGLAIFASRELLAIAFDASGSSTGIIAIPFILSLSYGISSLKKDSVASEQDSFGLVALASSGPIITILILDLISKTKEFAADFDSIINESDSIIIPFLEATPVYLKEAVMSILPLVIILIVLQIFILKLKKRDFRKLATGFIFAFIGLLLFLVGVNAGFMDLGSDIGSRLILMDNKIFILVVSFVLGAVTIVAEPSVYVLTHQVEDVTSGYVKRKTVLYPLVFGVGLAVLLSIVRILVPAIEIWHYLLPGYIINIALMFFAPKLFVGIGFDAGGVATGPITTTFILAFVQGAAQAHEGADLIADGFGMIAMVAMFSILTLQLLGVVYAYKEKKADRVKNE